MDRKPSRSANSRFSNCPKRRLAVSVFAKLVAGCSWHVLIYCITVLNPSRTTRLQLKLLPRAVDLFDCLSHCHIQE